MTKRLLPALACFAVVGAGCGGKTKEEVFIPPQDPQPAGEQAQNAKSSLSLDMKDIQFIPRDVALRSGGTITWTNRDRVGHTVTKRSGTGPDFDSGDVAPGKRYRRTFEAPGLVNYLCTIHPNMTGQIRVVE